MPIVRRTRADLDLSKVDWQRVAATTDREIAKQIAADPDTALIFFRPRVEPGEARCSAAGGCAVAPVLTHLAGVAAPHPEL